MTERAHRHHSFGPAVLAGLAGAGLAAVAGTRQWATTRGDAAGLRVEESVTGAEAAPLVAALALVALAAWGVVLVLRGRVRRLVAALGLLAGVGCLAAVVAGFGAVQDAAVGAAVDRGASGETSTTGLTAWYYLSGVGAALTAAAFAVAVRRSPSWPAMGRKYDAPSAADGAAARPAGGPVAEEDMWRALDEGRDPTS